MVTLFSAPNYCGEFDNAGGMMSVDETLMCSFQILKPSEKKTKYQYGGMTTGRPVTPPRTPAAGGTAMSGSTPGLGSTGPNPQNGLNSNNSNFNTKNKK